MSVDRKGSRTPRIRNHEAYTWPEDLAPLRGWLAAKLVDVDSLKSERQALWLTVSLAKARFAMPKRGRSCFPALLAFQRRLCGQEKGRAAPPSTKHRERLLGTFGPASEVRRIDPASYRPGGAR